MPKAATSSVIWREDRGTYEWRDQDDSSPRPLPADEGSAIGQFLRGSSFAFQGKHGRLTLRKEARTYGEGYWYAYRNQGHQVRKKYVGRTADLTIVRLEDIAEAFTAEAISSDDGDSRIKGDALLLRQAAARAEQGDTSLQRYIPGALSAMPAIPTGPAMQSADHRAPLLAAKLHLPHLHASLVARSRLLARLDAGLEQKLTLVSAPAGFGKTTLVRQWIGDLMAFDRDGHHLAGAAWVSLDAGDNDPIRFWRYVIAACQNFHAGLGQSALALFQSVQRPLFGMQIREPEPLEAALSLFLNDLGQLSGKSVLVLEDYHVITSEPLQKMVTFWLEHLPPTLHLVMTTRVDPPLPLARLRAHNELNELRAADLCFSREETSTFLQQSTSFPPSSESVTRLDAWMEGWVTGLRLLALALRGRMSTQEIEPYLSTFSGNHRHILDYFVAEVLEAQPEAIQTFLLHTCMLTRLTGSLCDAVTGRNDSAQILEAMEYANLFTLPLDEAASQRPAAEQRWYRYHLLFAEAMQHEAQRRLGEETLRESYARASAWYAQHGMLAEAIEVALQAHMFTKAATLIEQLIGQRPTHEMQEHHTLCRWLETLPESTLEQHPELCLHFAAALLFAPNRQEPPSLAEIERPLSLAERVFEVHSNHHMRGRIDAFRALAVVRLHGDLAQAARLARQALPLLHEDEQHWRGTCLRFIGAEEFLSGRLHQARQTLQEAQTLFIAVGNNYAARAGLFVLGDLCTLQGELHQAAELYRAALTTAGEDGATKSKALLGLARLAYEWNELEAAEQQAQQALDLGTRMGNELFQVQASLILVDVQHARGQITEAREMLHALLAWIQLHRSPQLYRSILLQQARLQLASGDLAGVESWSARSAMYREAVPRLQQEQEDLLIVRLLLAQGKADEALHRLESWLSEAREQGRIRSVLEIRILMALTYAAQQRQSQARQQLREALRLAHTQGYLRLFLDEGEAMIALLRTVLPALRRQLPAAYIRSLQRAFALQQLEQVVSLSPASSAPIAASLALIDPLSPQEQRVLRLLAAGFSNAEIAEALVVSINTVKTQVQSIYRKLNVQSRKEAREAVRSQELI
jgi:LuxR family maltose regulon positive regulatory protein